MRLPANLAAVGLMLDREHAASAEEIARATKSERALWTLSAWRKSMASHPYVVIAGQLHRADGGIVGGLARSWEEAKMLYGFAMTRLDELAADGAGFTSAWVLLLTEERTDELRGIAAARQQTAGAA